MGFLLFVVLMPVMLIWYILEKIFKDGLGRDVPFRGLDMVLLGVPTGLILWAIIIYECVKHISISIT